jgi:hypothetical protein
MDRGELEGLDRESLVVKAQAAGIRRARILTRPELIDELLRLDPDADDAQLRKSRGFFGRARDLVARVVERGLHLPDAAERIRTLALGTVPTSVVRSEPQAMPTVTLAEIYAAQGHRGRAIETLRRVLEREPDHGAARTLLARLEDDGYVAPPPPLPPEPEIEPDLSRDDDDDEVQAEAQDEANETHGEDAPTIAIAGKQPIHPIVGPSYGDSNGEAEFQLAPASERDARTSALDEGFLANDTFAERSGRTYTLTAPRGTRVDEVDVHAKTDVFDAVPAINRRIDSGEVETTELVLSELAEVPEVEECFAIPMARDDDGGRMFVRWSISWSTIGALLGARPNGRFVVRAHIVTPAWDGPNAETRDLIIDPDEEQTTLRALPDPSVVRVAVGWLDGSTFVPVAHSPALETSRARGLVIWTTKGAVPVVLDDPRAASIARAVDASRRAAQAHT